MKKPITRKEMIAAIYTYANVTPSIRKLSGMPLDTLRALYTWLFYGEAETTIEEDFHK